MLVDLEKPRHISAKQAPWKACLPFVDNSRGMLLHRPRNGSTYNIHKHPHIAVQFWCGMVVTASDGHLSFTDSPPEEKILCEKCEAAAVANGLPSASELAGKHVHIGRTKAVITCCGEQ